MTDWHALVAQHAERRHHLDKGSAAFIHFASQGSKKVINVFHEPWCKLRWGKIQADRYLAPSPKGAFIIRKASQPGEFVLSVQAGVRVCHVLLKVICGEDERVLYNIYPTPQWFESLFDLPFMFRNLHGTEPITLSLEASSKAHRLNQILRAKNAEGKAAASQRHGEADEDPGAILFRGYLTKQGRVRKTWKRRFFELSDDGHLRYFTVAGKDKEQGSLNLKKVRAVIPGAKCVVQWHPQANPNYCFGILACDRELFLFADTKDELQGWLQAIRQVVDEKFVTITTPEDIRRLATEATQGAPTKQHEAERRITLRVFRNGSTAAGIYVEVPKDDLDGVKAAISPRVGFPVVRIFNQVGGEHTVPETLRKDDIVFVSSGSSFVGMATAARGEVEYDAGRAVDEYNDGYASVDPMRAVPKGGHLQGYADVSLLDQDSSNGTSAQATTSVDSEDEDAEIDAYHKPKEQYQNVCFDDNDAENDAYLETDIADNEVLHTTSAQTSESQSSEPAMAATPTTVPAAATTGPVEPEAAEPEAAETEAVEPEAAEPEATEPEATETEAVEPEAVEPEAAETEAVETEATETEAVEIEAADPGAADPGAADPGAAEPEAAETEADETEAAEPEAAEPEVAEKATEATEPEVTQTEPEATEPEVAKECPISLAHLAARLTSSCLDPKAALPSRSCPTPGWQATLQSPQGALALATALLLLHGVLGLATRPSWRRLVLRLVTLAGTFWQHRILSTLTSGEDKAIRWILLLDVLGEATMLLPVGRSGMHNRVVRSLRAFARLLLALQLSVLIAAPLYHHWSSETWQDDSAACWIYAGESARHGRAFDWLPTVLPRSLCTALTQAWRSADTVAALMFAVTPTLMAAPSDVATLPPILGRLATWTVALFMGFMAWDWRWAFILVAGQEALLRLCSRASEPQISQSRSKWWLTSAVAASLFITAVIFGMAVARHDLNQDVTLSEPLTHIQHELKLYQGWRHYQRPGPQMPVHRWQVNLLHAPPSASGDNDAQRWERATCYNLLNVSQQQAPILDGPAANCDGPSQYTADPMLEKLFQRIQDLDMQAEDTFIKQLKPTWCQHAVQALRARKPSADPNQSLDEFAVRVRHTVGSVAWQERTDNYEYRHVATQLGVLHMCGSLMKTAA
ncbi:uncharacterized protein MONBRDRAFT_28839 [Monosiga brevicollis MX1]|uniref:PH domain-containing protein n=1 Tax=Monosiga brevicollis TaxID=81824 RepID=A9V976_MONBE|nr:uncharacterized protein MONBRDRAFT_28839 [Monosiga brevicollis MX1]EDQ85881.1 predicted protein [Monosiga brevicollis MX1]|eukprot:XP_001749360.1 hypothetical protein [Monosiga brevicollis MX1]